VVPETPGRISQLQPANPVIRTIRVKKKLPGLVLRTKSGAHPPKSSTISPPPTHNQGRSQQDRAKHAGPQTQLATRVAQMLARSKTLRSLPYMRRNQQNHDECNSKRQSPRPRLALIALPQNTHGALHHPASPTRYGAIMICIQARERRQNIRRDLGSLSARRATSSTQE